MEELRAETPEVEAALWRFVLDLDLVEQVTALRRPVDEPLRWRLANPRKLRLTASEDMLYLKILDVAAAFEARGYRSAGVLVLGVTPPPGAPVSADPALGNWVLDAGPDGAACRRASTGEEPDLTIERVGSRLPLPGWVRGVDTCSRRPCPRVLPWCPGRRRPHADHPAGTADHHRLLRARSGGARRGPLGSSTMASPLTPRAEDFPRWYQDVITQAELADNGPVRGTMVIRPWGYAIWERMQAALDMRIKEAGAENAYFPLFIPESYLRREAEHVEGFSPELAVVTHGGGKELEEPVVVRPTSETVINSFFAKWVHSYRDLPLLINQWANVLRWELRPRLFLRTERVPVAGRPHRSRHRGRRPRVRPTDPPRRLRGPWYVLAIPVHARPQNRSGALRRGHHDLDPEAMMGDGKALQMGTSHELGQSFAKAFGISFLDESGQKTFAWQTSWGFRPGSMGAVIMAHGDDSGLRLPPALAPVEVVVVLVRGEGGAAQAAGAIADELRREGLRVRVDDRLETSFGRRSVEWELKGVPVRVEVGPRGISRRVS